MNYYKKYLKYKHKYIKLKSQIGGNNTKCEKLLDKEIIKNNFNSKIKKILEEIKKYNNMFFLEIKNYNGSNKILNNYEIKHIVKNIDIVNIFNFYNKILINYNEFSYYFAKHLFVTKNINEYLFFIKIYNFYFDNFNVFLLGDSLYKIKKMHEFITNTNYDNVIKFSGNMFDKSIDKFNNEYIIQINENIIEFYNENKKFIDIIFNSLNNYDAPKIIIFDYSLKGFSLLTFVECLKKINEKKFLYDNIENKIKDKLLFISFVMFDVSLSEIINNLGQPKTIIDYVLFCFNDLDMSFIPHLINSDKINGSQLCSRCVPKYDPPLWKNHNDIFIDVTDDNINYKNYLGCNLNNLYIYIFLIYIFKTNDFNIENIKLDDTTFDNIIYISPDNLLILNQNFNNLIKQHFILDDELNTDYVFSFNGKYIV